MKKQIGIVGWKTGENSFGVTVPYFEYFSQFGEVSILSPGQYKDLDLLILPGGLDVDPARYNNIPSLNSSNSNILLEFFDKNILPKYIENKTKIFGICRGLQTLNVYFGGTINQDIPYHPYSNPRDERIHEVVSTFKFSEFDKRFFYGKTKIKVNSLHHQAILNLGVDLESILVSKDDEEIEAIKHKELPIYAVQYHPEELNCSMSNFLILKLLTM